MPRKKSTKVEETKDRKQEAAAVEVEESKDEIEGKDTADETVETSTNIEDIEEKGTAVDLTGEKVLIFKAKKPLTPNEFSTLSDYLKQEQEKTGLKIVLVPFSAELEE